MGMCSPSNLYLLTFSLLFLSSLTLSLSQNVVSPQFMPPFPECNPNDKKVLLQIMNHYHNASSAFSTWGPDPNCCAWPNIICDDRGRVTSVTVAYSFDVVGGIPPVVADLPYLTALRFFELSNLTSIPRTITKLTMLQELDLVSNGLSGPIPDFLSEIKSLKLLYLSSNRFTGSIPESFGSLAGLILHVDDNQLSGPIPKSLGQANLAALDVSGNRLTGDVSFLFGKGKALKSINLKKNKFKFDFSNVDLPQGLKSIDIAHNEIYGSLPKRLGQLPLNYIDVSYNMLCGPIPEGRRLKQFNATRFAHNKCLCGPPLAPCKN